MEETRRYILLPKAGLRAAGGPALETLSALPEVRSTGDRQAVQMGEAAGRSVEVIDSTAADGPRLVQLDDEAAAALNRPQSPLRAVPEVEYPPPDLPPAPPPTTPAAVAAGPATMTVTCTDATTGAGLADAEVTVFAGGSRVKGLSGPDGSVRLGVSGATVDGIVVSPPPGYWGTGRGQLPVQDITIPLTPVDLSFVDSVRRYYGNTRFDASTGVVVGVIDTGAGPHGQLNLVGGRNTVTGEQPADYADARTHGTHVSGLVGAGGAPPNGLRGMAPGVPIRAYRVFGPAGGASNYAILKALIFAAVDGCDIVNLSLGGGPEDEIVREAIIDARNSGMLVIAAAGNDYRRPVNYPAAYVGATAVSAMGRKGTWPPGATEDGFVAHPPHGTDGDEFIAAFSNVGPQLAATAPGVGALSTLPGDQFGPMSGTSMAAPVVAGAAACLLSREPVLYAMPRDAARSTAISNLLLGSCSGRGFGVTFEGAGMPDPAKI